MIFFVIGIILLIIIIYVYVLTTWLPFFAGMRIQIWQLFWWDELGNHGNWTRSNTLQCFTVDWFCFNSIPPSFKMCSFDNRVRNCGGVSYIPSSGVEVEHSPCLTCSFHAIAGLCYMKSEIVDSSLAWRSWEMAWSQMFVGYWAKLGRMVKEPSGWGHSILLPLMMFVSFDW